MQSVKTQALYKYLLWLLLPVVVINNSYAGTSISKKNVKDCIQLYEELLTTYCNSKNENKIRTSKRDILVLCDFDNGTPCAFDLFNQEELEEGDFHTYLQDIASTYHNQVEVAFDDDMYINDFYTTVEGEKFVYATIRKTLKYVGDVQQFKNKVRSITLLIGVNVTNPEYKISSVIIPEEYDASRAKRPITRDHYIPNDFSKVYLGIAGDRYNNKEYLQAKEWFEKVLIFQPDNKEAKEKINACEAKISCDDYKELADGVFGENNFSYAQKQYQYIYNNCPQYKDSASIFVKACTDTIPALKFKFYWNDGKYLYHKGFYPAAIVSFQKALTYKPGADSCRQMIEKCKAAHSTVIDTLRNAVYIAEQEHEFVKAFKIMADNEESGLLTGENYYFMAMVASGKDSKKIARLMEYTNAECREVAREYCLKAIVRGNIKARQLWESRTLK